MNWITKKKNGGAWTSGVNLVSQVACIIILSFGYSLKYIESGKIQIFFIPSPALYLYCAISTIFIFCTLCKRDTGDTSGEKGDPTSKQIYGTVGGKL